MRGQVLCLPLLIQLRQCHAHIERCPYGEASVVFQSGANCVAPDRHDRVADELMQRTAVAVHTGDHLGEIFVELGDEYFLLG